MSIKPKAGIVLHPSGSLIIDGLAFWPPDSRPLPARLRWAVAENCDDKTTWYAPLRAFASLEDAWRVLDEEEEFLRTGKDRDGRFPC
jgi:hypothetical protein